MDYSTLNSIQTAIRDAGLEPPEPIEPGRVIRFPGAGKRPGNRSAWCYLFPDGKGGVFGDWSSGLNHVWQSPHHQRRTEAERAEFRRQLQLARAKARRQREHEHAQAASRARSIWERTLGVPPDHPYLVKKHIQRYTARLYRGALVVPIVDTTGEIHSLQFIAPDGSKKMLKDGRKQGCFIPVANFKPRGDTWRPIAICEGFATGCTIAQEQPHTSVLAAIDAGNLEPVARAIRSWRPEADIIICGDDDRLTPGNPGRTKANAAALATNSAVNFPNWPEGIPETSTDFNDLRVWLREGRL